MALLAFNELDVTGAVKLQRGTGQSRIYTYIVSLFKLTVIGGASWVLPRSLLGFHHCLKETSLLPDKNVNRLLVINLSVVRIEAVALTEM